MQRRARVWSASRCPAAFDAALHAQSVPLGTLLLQQVCGFGARAAAAASGSCCCSNGPRTAASCGATTAARSAVSRCTRSRDGVGRAERARERSSGSCAGCVCHSIFHSELRRGGCDETAASCACVRRIISEHHSNASSLTHRYSLCCSGVRRFGPWKQQETPPSARAALSTPAGYRSAYLKRAPWRAAVRAAATTDAPGQPPAISNRCEQCPDG